MARFGVTQRTQRVHRRIYQGRASDQPQRTISSTLDPEMKEQRCHLGGFVDGSVSAGSRNRRAAVVGASKSCLIPAE